MLGSDRRRAWNKKSSDGDALRQVAERLGDGMCNSGGASQAVPACAVLEDESDLREAAVGDHGLANLCAEAVKVFDPAAGEDQVGVSLELAARAAFALLCSFVAVELIFERQDDHAYRGNYLAHHDDAGQVQIEEHVAAHPGDDAQAG